MKKFKFFALAALLLGSTSAFAAITKGEKQTVNGVQYEVLTVFANASSGDNTVKVTSNNYSGTTLVIPATVDLPIEGTDTYGNDVTGTKTFKVVEIATAAGVGAFQNCTSITSVQIGANVTTIGDNAFKGCTNLATITFDAAAANQTFGANILEGTKVATLDLTTTKIAQLKRWFTSATVNGTLTEVKLPATLTTIDASAFEDCASLSKVDFSLCALLNAIGDFAFGSTSLTAVDFTGCPLLVDFTTAGYQTPFVANTGLVNKMLATVTLNTNTTAIGTALANLEALATVNIELTKLGSVDASAFANDKALTTLTLPAQCVTIADDGLKDSYIQTLTIKGNAAIGATAATKLTEITFAGTAAFAGNIAANAFKGNADLAKVTFAKGINLATGKVIGADAFAGTAAKKSLTEVSLGNVADYDSQSIKAGAFVLSTAAASTVTIGKITSANPFTADAFTGSGVDGKLTTLTIGDIEATLTQELVSDHVGAVEVGAIKAAVNTAAFGSATSITFNGDITAGGLVGTTAAAAVTTLTAVTFNGDIKMAAGIGEYAFAKYTKLATVTINGKMTVAGAIADKSFYDDGGTKPYAGSAVTDANGNAINMVVTYNPLHDDILTGANYEIVATAFAEAAYPAASPVNVTLSTTRDFGLKYNAIANTYKRVAWEYAAEEVAIEMAAPAGSSYYYAKFYKNSAYKISKKQNGEDVMVYNAYVDEADAKIYYEQLHIINGYYEIPAKAPVIIKSKASEGIIAEGNATANSLTYTNNGGAVVNNQIFYTNAVVGSTLKAATPTAGDNPYVAVLGANTAYNLYALGKIAKFGLEWKPFADNVALPDGTFYVRCNKLVDAARLQNVWLDGSEEEATGIQKVQNETEDGAIYNLQGVRVNAAQKGIFIKNGKKYIVK